MYLGWNFKSRSSAWKVNSENAQIAVSGRDMWRDIRGNVYASDGIKQYKYNKNNYQWEPVTWNIYIEKGRYVWWSFAYDGGEVFYSNGSAQYALNETTDQWEPVEWKDLNDPDPDHVLDVPFLGTLMWPHGIAQDYGSYFYSDNGVTQTGVNHQWQRVGARQWIQVTWSGMTPQAGDYIWLADTTGNGRFYYSNGFQQYELDRRSSYSNYTWVPKTWTVTPDYGINVWRDPYLNKIYYSNWLGQGAGAKQLEFDPTTQDFDLKTWNTTLSSYAPQGYGIWRIDKHVYCNISGYIEGITDAIELI